MPPEPVDILEETVPIPGPGGALRGVLAYPLADKPARAALVVGPHPLMGGGADNNVVRAVARGLAEHGFLSLRFHFGGDRPSARVMDVFWRTGHAPDDPGRALEAAAAFGWLGRTHPAPTVLVGYSFGAALLSGLHEDARVSHLVLIGPTLTQHRYRAIAAAALPKLIITADNDFATPLETTRAWFRSAQAPKRLVLLEAAEHFYRHQEQRLVREILTWLRS